MIPRTIPNKESAFSSALHKPFGVECGSEEVAGERAAAGGIHTRGEAVERLAEREHCVQRELLLQRGRRARVEVDARLPQLHQLASETALLPDPNAVIKMLVNENCIYDL